MMRNDNTDIYPKPVNLKSITKLPPTPIGKDFLNRINNFKNQKKDVDFGILSNKNEKSQASITSKGLNSGTLYSQDKIKNNGNKFDSIKPGNEKYGLRASLQKAKHDFLCSGNDFPKLNEDNLKKFSNLLLKQNETINILKNYSNDSRETGGGKEVKVSSETSNEKNNINDHKTDSVSLFKKTHYETNITPKVSFKTKNGCRKPVYSTKVVNTAKVAVLAQKFNEIIKENNSNKNEEKSKYTHAATNKANNTNEKHSNINSKTLPSSDNKKCNSAEKTNNDGIQKLEDKVKASNKPAHTEAPLLHKNVLRVKSDGRKRNSLKKRSGEYYSKNELVYNTQVCKLDKDSSENKIEIIELRTNVKSSVRRKPSFKTSPTRHYVGIVHATIQKFESEKSSEAKNVNNNSNSITEKVASLKPKIPEKRVNVLKTKNLVVKDGRPKIKIIRSNIIENKKEESKHKINKEEIIKVKQDSGVNNIKANRMEPSENKSNVTNESDCSLSNTNEILNSKIEYDCDKTNLSTVKTKPSLIKDNFKPESDISICNKEKKSKKEFHYDKVSLRKILNNEKLTLPININDCVAEEILNTEPDIKKVEKTDNEKFYQEVSARIKPNESFLWRTNLKSDLVSSKESEDKTKHLDTVSEIYDTLGPPRPIEDTKISTFEKYLKEVNEIFDNNNDNKLESLLASDDEEVSSSNSPIVQAINTNIVNSNQRIEEKVILDEDYEPLEPYQEDQIKITETKRTPQLHSKANCPLPDVPKQCEENIYQCLSEIRPNSEKESTNMHNYEHWRNNDSNEIKTESNDDSDDGYEYCKSPILKEKKIEPSTDELPKDYEKRFSVTKSNSITSSIDYEKISSIYEKINSKSSSLDNSPEKVLSYDDCEENFYDVIKHSDTASISNCYESITDGPRYNLKMKRPTSMKELSQMLPKPQFIEIDTISTFSQSTISSDQKSNSLYSSQKYGVRFDKQNSFIYGECLSEMSFSDRSDRSDEWEDISSDHEKPEADRTIIIVREKSKGRHSPASWSRKVRYQWTEAAKQLPNSDLFVSSPSTLYIPTCKLTRFYSDNDESNLPPQYQNAEEVTTIKHTKLLKCNDLKGLAVLKCLILPDNYYEIQETTVFIDSSDEHLYESLSHSALDSTTNGQEVIEEDYDSFDSDLESEQSFVHIQNSKTENEDDIAHSQLPDPPLSSNSYTLTRFATAAGKKMKQLKQNLTKSTRRKSDEKNGIPTETKQTPLFTLTRQKKNVASNENISDSVYQGVILMPNKKEETKATLESKLDSNVNRLSQILIGQELFKTNGSNANNEQITSNKSKDEKDASRKSYLSFKSKFRRSISSNPKLNTLLSTVPNSTFYLENEENSSNNNGETKLYESNETITPNDQKISEETIIMNNENVRKSLQNGRITSKFNMRPNEPPPPPPEDPKKDKKDRRLINSSSWYDECSVFKSSENYKENIHKSRARSCTSWYAEIGLYQSSNNSTSSGASSTLSGSGTCSTTTAFSSPSTPTPPIGMFNQEPLYQFYNQAKLESVCRDLASDSDVENYEDISNCDDNEYCEPIQRPPAMSLILPTKGPSRTLWCEIPEVINSSFIDSLTPKQKKLQEAKFEIIASEASYLNSLSVLESQYINNIAFQDERLLSKTDKQILFGNISPVKRCSERLMSDLETCWQDSILLRGLCKIIKYHAEKYFHVYVRYCENQIYLGKTLKKLKTDAKFNEIANYLQSQPACQSLSLDSFLMLPMQRVTRLPLLIDAVLRHLDDDSDEYKICVDTLTALNSIVSKCNEGARNTDRTEEMFIISSQIEFPMHIKEIPIIIPNEEKKSKAPQRWLIRSGELIQLLWRGDDQPKLTFGKKISKISLHFFLFTDLLIVTKRRSNEDLFTVVDYCKRSLIEMTPSDMMAQSPGKEIPGKFIVLLTMLENHENKTVEMLLSCANETDRQRWIEALTPPTLDSDEKIYEGWDCPQVTALYNYQSMQPDELTLQPGDIINVNRKMADGWYHGERITDGESGWFPGNYTAEIASAHVRARNLRQRYRLLALSGSYLAKERKKSIL